MSTVDPSVSPADTIRRYVLMTPSERSAKDRRDIIAALDALLAVGERDKAEIERLNAEANDLSNRAETAEAEAERLRVALERIASEPPDRGVTPNFREFARAVLADKEDE